jgi:hypothetical protein
MGGLMRLEFPLVPPSLPYLASSSLEVGLPMNKIGAGSPVLWAARHSLREGMTALDYKECKWRLGNSPDARSARGPAFFRRHAQHGDPRRGS